MDPCAISTLTLDDSVFKMVFTPTLQQYVTYSSLQVSWDDSVVTSSLTDPSICGPLVHEVVEPSTGAAIPQLTGDPLWTNDLLTQATKTLDV